MCCKRVRGFFPIISGYLLNAELGTMNSRDFGISDGVGGDTSFLLYGVCCSLYDVELISIVLVLGK